jgi:hypothetical protein
LAYFPLQESFELFNFGGGGWGEGCIHKKDKYENAKSNFSFHVLSHCKNQRRIRLKAAHSKGYTKFCTFSHDLCRKNSIL